ncbi:MAG: serine hydrolase domain-containing protein [Cyanobacteria bacterium J06638_22]
MAVVFLEHGNFRMLHLNPQMLSRRIRLKILVTIGLILLWALAVIAVVFAEAFWLARPTAPRGDLAAIENYLVQNLSQATAQKLGSAALILVEEDEIAAEHSFGVADPETQAPVKPHQTLYQLASVSKVVSAWGVMKLVEEGALALDEPVLSYLTRWQFPMSDEHRNKVTVRHLLSHTAGLEDGFGYDGFLSGDAIQTLEESLTLTQNPSFGEPRGVTVVREPGKEWYYSGGGYTILQLLIEEVTKRSFADYMAEAVLQPLGMTGASFDWEMISSEGRAGDLATSFDAELKPSGHRRYTATAAASLYATPQDMAQFIRAYARGNPVLSQETLDQMMSPQPGTDNIRGWGLGHILYVENDAGGYVVGHDSGNSPALGHTVRVNPATGNGIVLMISGNLRLASQLGDDWVYWETGKLSFFARMGILGSRLVPGLVAIVFGAIAIVLWKLLK